MCVQTNPSHSTWQAHAKNNSWTRSWVQIRTGTAIIEYPNSKHGLWLKPCCQQSAIFKSSCQRHKKLLRLLQNSQLQSFQLKELQVYSFSCEGKIARVKKWLIRDVTDLEQSMPELSSRNHEWMHQDVHMRLAALFRLHNHSEERQATWVSCCALAWSDKRYTNI